MAVSRSLESITEALYTYMARTVSPVEVSPRWRRQGDQLPYVTYEFTSANWQYAVGGMTNMVTISINWSCVATTVQGAMQIADDITAGVLTTFDQDGVTFHPTDLNMRTLDAVPDDGTGDAERIIVVTTTLLTHEG